MNRIIVLFGFFLSGILTLVFFACTKEDNIFKEYENNWKECYDSNFQFEQDSVQLDGNYISCNLANHVILINEENSEYKSLIYYKTSGFVSNPDITLSNDTGSRHQVLLYFVKPQLLTGFCIALDYPKDSLNYTIQKTFEKGKIEFSTNFINKGIAYSIETSCEPNGGIIFSTQYSMKENQELTIINFSATLLDNTWHYQLEYSANDLEITNENWNSRYMFDGQGKKLKSKVLIENLPLTSLHGKIQFDIDKQL